MTTTTPSPTSPQTADETATIGSMTKQELLTLVDARVQIRQFTELYEMRVEKGLMLLRPPRDDRSYEEVFASIAANRIQPPPGSPSNVELLREDRDA